MHITLHSVVRQSSQRLVRIRAAVYTPTVDPLPMTVALARPECHESIQMHSGDLRGSHVGHRLPNRIHRRRPIPIRDSLAEFSLQ